MGGSAKQERGANLNFLQLSAENALFERLKINRNIRQFGHLQQSNWQVGSQAKYNLSDFQGLW